MLPPAPESTLEPDAWSRIDTVMLDLDGTLLDLCYDTHFWNVLVPQQWGRAHGLALEEAQRRLRPLLDARRGTLDWYCIDYWSREFGLDIRALKIADAHRVRWLPGARGFLERVRALGKRLVLLTNAHPATLAIKDGRVQVTRHFDSSFSSQVVGAPKEDARFWRDLAVLEPHVPGRCLFVDDAPAVLRAARAAGIGTLFIVRQPDTTRAPQAQAPAEFAAIDRVEDLLPG
ncbi:MAG: HAD-IA family hydrolase [Gammaproteobacteria bacterium]|nr:HAD-IA family hydrolase [Gammaproteobacteria bacterium]